MSTAPLLHEADANQARAADPEASAWVSANAGTGKTAVLVKRALRLLLAGSKPEAILCLTYTKNAAAEMQNRLLDVLADWATIPSEALHTQLVDLLGRAPEAAELRVAKRLFAKALEARGGLKIHTIHGFCERLLQRFPLEAQITPHFKVLDEHGAARLKQQAYEATIARAAEGRDSALGRALAKAITYTSDDYFRKVVETVLAKRSELARMLAYHESADDWAEAESQALKRLFDVAEEEEEPLIAALAGVLSDAEIDAAIAAFAAFGGTAKTDQRRRTQLCVRPELAVVKLASTALKPLFLIERRRCPRTDLRQAFANDAPDIAALLDDAKSRSPRLARSWRGCAWRRRAAPYSLSPTPSTTIMSGGSARKPCSIMTI